MAIHLTLDHLKALAHKSKAELAREGLSTLGHKQLLDLQARIHGFTNYEEAKAQLERPIDAESSPDALASDATSILLREPGGLLSFDAVVENMARHIVPIFGSHLLIQGPHSSGKTTLACELIIQALSEGRHVRVIDSNEFSYNNLTCIVDGRFCLGSSQGVDAYLDHWSSDANLVAVGSPPSFFSQNAFDRLASATPKGSVVVWDGADRYYHQGQSLGRFAMVYISTEDIGYSPRQARLLALARDGSAQSQRLFQYSESEFGSSRTVRLFAGPQRLSVYGSSDYYDSVAWRDMEVSPANLVAAGRQLIAELRDHDADNSYRGEDVFDN